MPNAWAPVTTKDIRRMRELRAEGVDMEAIAAIVGVCRSTVYAYAGDVEKPAVEPKWIRDKRAKLEARALRYAAFVERAAAYVPLLVSPSPF